jgi:hypothetical protein
MKGVESRIVGFDNHGYHVDIGFANCRKSESIPGSTSCLRSTHGNLGGLVVVKINVHGIRQRHYCNLLRVLCRIVGVLVLVSKLLLGHRSNSRSLRVDNGNVVFSRLARRKRLAHHKGLVERRCIEAVASLHAAQRLDGILFHLGFTLGCGKVLGVTLDLDKILDGRVSWSTRLHDGRRRGELNSSRLVDEPTLELFLRRCTKYV